MLSLGKQYYNLNVVNLLKWVMFCRMFKKAVLKKSRVSYMKTMFNYPVAGHW